MNSRWLTVALAGAGGFALGAWWSPRGDKGAPFSDEAVMPVAEIAAPVRAPLDPVPSEPLPREHSSRIVTTSPLDRARIVSALARDGLAGAAVRLLEGTTREMKLSEGFKRLFAITPSEAEALEQALRSARDRVSAVEVELAQAGPGQGEEEGRWIISIPPFPEHGAVIHDETYQAIAGTLGPERLAMFEQLMGNQLEQVLGRMGTQGRRIVVSSKPNGATGQVIFETKDHFVSADSSGWSGSAFLGRGGLDDHFGELTRRLLPPEFGAKQ